MAVGFFVCARRKTQYAHTLTHNTPHNKKTTDGNKDAAGDAAAFRAGLLGGKGQLKALGTGALRSGTADLVELYTKQGAALSEYAIKKVQDYIDGVNAASTLTQSLLKSGGAALTGASGGLLRSAKDVQGTIAGAKAAGLEGLQARVRFCGGVRVRVCAC